MRVGSVGWTMVVEEVKGVLLGGSWLAAKEMWSCGCQSWVAILRGKGSVRRWFMGAMTAGPSGTASEPVWCED